MPVSTNVKKLQLSFNQWLNSNYRIHQQNFAHNRVLNLSGEFWPVKKITVCYLRTKGYVKNIFINVFIILFVVSWRFVFGIFEILITTY